MKHQYHNRSHFYRYFDAPGAIASLENLTLRLTSPSQFNDPFDIKFHKAHPFTAEELLRASAEKTADAIEAGRLPPLVRKAYRIPDLPLQSGASKKLPREKIIEAICGDEEFVRDYKLHHDKITKKTNEELERFFGDLFLYCLTTERDNSLMWAHYGEKHTGAVIRYECIAEMDNVFLAALPVHYSEQMPTFGTKEEWLDLLSGGNGVDPETLIRRIVTWKASEWSYENEWRIVLPVPHSKGKPHTFVSIEPREVSEIYLGQKMLDIDKEKILKMVNDTYPHVWVYQSKMSRNAPKLEFEIMSKGKINT